MFTHKMARKLDFTVQITQSVKKDAYLFLSRLQYYIFDD